jgi:glycosyltransferase involved in cell wall biosynthesis
VAAGKGGRHVNGMSVTVVIPTLNRPAMVRRCVESILRGERLPRRIVVCDQSTGTAAAETRRQVESAPEHGVEVRYIHLAVPSASAARNKGLDAARTDVVAFIDDDCVAAEGWLAALMGTYEGTSDTEPVSAVTGRVLPMRTRRRGVALSSRTSTERRLFRGRDGSMERGEWAPWDAGTGGNILAPRTTLLAVGGFDPSLGPGSPAAAAEDIDLLYKLGRMGTIVYEPGAVVYHPQGTRRARLLSRYRYGRGMGAMLARHLARKDPAARQLLWLYLRHQGAHALRSGRLGPVETLLSLAGVSMPVARYWAGTLRPRKQLRAGGAGAGRRLENGRE